MGLSRRRHRIDGDAIYSNIGAVIYSAAAQVYHASQPHSREHATPQCARRIKRLAPSGGPSAICQIIYFDSMRHETHRHHQDDTLIESESVSGNISKIRRRSPIRFGPQERGVATPRENAFRGRELPSSEVPALDGSRALRHIDGHISSTPAERATLGLIDATI